MKKVLIVVACIGVWWALCVMVMAANYALTGKPEGASVVIGAVVAASLALRLGKWLLKKQNNRARVKPEQEIKGDDTSSIEKPQSRKTDVSQSKKRNWITWLPYVLELALVCLCVSDLIYSIETMYPSKQTSWELLSSNFEALQVIRTAQMRIGVVAAYCVIFMGKAATKLLRSPIFLLLPCLYVVLSGIQYFILSDYYRISSNRYGSIHFNDERFIPLCILLLVILCLQFRSERE